MALSNYDKPNCGFIAPNTDKNLTLEFKLEVTETNSKKTISDTIKVFVKEATQTNIPLSIKMDISPNKESYQIGEKILFEADVKVVAWIELSFISMGCK